MAKPGPPYPFRYKPQDVRQPPRIYAPYQPRFDWNLWFASLGTWSQYPIVPRTEELLLINDPDVLQLFAGNPFSDKPPQLVRAVLWQYWFSTMQEKRTEGIWWRRQLLGTYAPTLRLNRTAELAWWRSHTWLCRRNDPRWKEEYDGTTSVVRNRQLSANEIGYLRWKAERGLKTRHMPAAFRYDPWFVARNAARMAAHPYRVADDCDRDA